MDDQINRKLFLLDEVYEVFSYDKIKQTVIDFEKTLEEMDAIIDTLSRVEVILETAGENTEETVEYVRTMSVQRIYLNENLNIFKDALSLCEEDMKNNLN